LVTRNVEDFRRIDELTILNPFEDGWLVRIAIAP
jgi:hypothetical protein